MEKGREEVNQRERADRYDILDCIYFDNECPSCRKKLEISLGMFKFLNLCKGLVYECPHCNTEFIIKDVVLEKYSDDLGEKK